MCFPEDIPPRVLVVDDSFVNQMILVAILESQDCAVTLASDGMQALEHIAAAEFDLVLMDIQMPVMDGLTATSLIRERESGSEKQTYIVAVTAGVEREKCIEAGMDDYLAKPVRLETLHEKLDQALARRRA